MNKIKRILNSYAASCYSHFNFIFQRCKLQNESFLQLIKKNVQNILSPKYNMQTIIIDRHLIDHVNQIFNILCENVKFHGIRRNVKFSLLFLFHIFIMFIHNFGKRFKISRSLHKK